MCGVFSIIDLLSNYQVQFPNMHKRELAGNALTGARDSARNIKTAPNKSISKPKIHALLKA